MSVKSPTTKHIVDQLIEERAVRLKDSAIWPLVKAIAYPVLRYQLAVSMADEAAKETTGFGAMRFASDFLQLDVDVEGVEHVPATGPCIIVANHPGGVADGVAAWRALHARRPDLCFFANRDAERVSRGFREAIIPVEWRESLRTRQDTRETLQRLMEAAALGRCIAIFPAGRMAEWNFKRWRTEEKPWIRTALSLVRRTGAPVIPLGIDQRMSALFYGLGLVSEEMKHMTVFHEFVAKRRARYGLQFGSAFPVEEHGEDALNALRGRTLELAERAK